MATVAAALRTNFAQPDAATVAADWDEVRNQLAKSLSEIGPLVDEAKTEDAGLHRDSALALVEDLEHEPYNARK